METSYIELDTVHSGAALAAREAQRAIDALLGSASYLPSFVTRTTDDVLDLDNEKTDYTPDMDTDSIRVFHPAQKAVSPFETALSTLRTTSLDVARVSAKAAGVSARLTLGGILALDKKCGDLIYEAGNRLRTVLGAASYELAPAIASIPMAHTVTVMPSAPAHLNESVRRVPVIRYYAPVALSTRAPETTSAEPYRLPIQGRNISRETVHPIRKASAQYDSVDAPSVQHTSQVVTEQAISNTYQPSDANTVRTYLYALRIVVTRLVVGSR